MCLSDFMKFQHCLFKILKNQNVADGQTNGRTDNVKTVYPTTNTVCGVKLWGGINIFDSEIMKIFLG